MSAGGAPTGAAPETGRPRGEGGGDQIEWRPVATGGTIEWQPVVAGGDEPPPEPEFDEEAWEAALKAEPASGRNGAGGADHPARGPRRPRPQAGGPPPFPPAGGRGAQAGGSGGGGRPDKTKRQVVILSVLTVFVLLVALIGFMLSRSATTKGNQALPGGGGPTTTRPATGGTTVPATELTLYRDEQTGVSVRYPKAWNRLHPPVADIRAVLVAGENDAVSFRILPIQTVATQENIGNFKAVTDAIVFGNNQNKLIQEQLVLLNGKLCYYYLYTFIDKDTNQQGVHAHYFIFEGLRIVSVVFQSLPAEDFNRQAAVFDQVAESIVIDPVPAGATTVPVPTSVR